MSDCFHQNQQIARFGLLLPQPRQFEEGSQPSLLVSKGPNKEFDLATITGKSAASIMRQAANKLWTLDEQKNLMLSPKANPRSGAPARRANKGTQMKGKDALEFSGDVLSFELQKFDGSLVSVLICILLSPRFLAKKVCCEWTIFVFCYRTLQTQVQRKLAGFVRARKSQLQQPGQ